MKKLVLRLGLVGTLIAAATVAVASPAAAVWAGVLVDGWLLEYFDAPDATANLNLKVRTSGTSIVFDADYAIQVHSPECVWASADYTKVVCSGLDAVTSLHIFGYGGNDVIDVDLAAPFDTLEEWQFGGDGNDILMGSRGVSALVGDAGDDVMYGRGGNDGMIAGDGRDQMYGGPGIDTVDYSSRSVAVNVSLDGVLGNDGAPGEGDTVGADVENVWGSPLNDVLIGNDASNLIRLCGGNDVVDAKGGDDVIREEDGNGHDCGLPSLVGWDLIIGGAGVDTVDYNRHAMGVTVDLDDAYGDDGSPGEGDSLIGIENVKGTPYNDFIVGNNGPNILYGFAGNDKIYGLGGDDAIYGEAGNDTLLGGDGSDYLNGGDGSDTCDVGPGGMFTVSCSP